MAVPYIGSYWMPELYRLHFPLLEHYSMTPEKRELLRLCRDALETPISERHRDSWAVQAKQLARDIKDLLTRPEAQGETPRTDAEVEGISWFVTDNDQRAVSWTDYECLADFARQLERALSAEEHRTCDDPLARLRSEAEQRARGQLLNHEPVRIHAMSQVTKSGIPIKWGTNRRDGKEHTEWHAPCGCAWHPEPAPHWHPCEAHSPERELSAKREGLPVFVRKRVERALDEGLHPKGMSTHRGKIVLDACDVQALLKAAATKEGQ